MYDDTDEPLDEPYDEVSDDIITSDVIDAIVERHDSDMDDARVWMGMAKATYGGRFWEWVHEQGKGSTDRRYRLFEDQYEINLIKKGVNVYHSSLFPKRMKGVVDRLATSTGDPEKAQTLLNSWMFTEDMRARIDTAIRQALLYPGVGLKVSYDPRSGEGHKSLSPHERVYARVFPWYELVLDTFAMDTSEARFYGHITYKSRREVSELYDIPYSDLRGAREHSFLDEDSAYDSRYGGGGRGGDELQGDYVRVLELCNLVDTLKGNNYPGRFEVHLIDQGEHSLEPVYVGEMPLWRPDGRPVQHIVPLIFEHEAEYPLQGIAPCRSWLHQQAEVNAYRSQMASESRKNKTVYLYDRNLGADVIQRIASARTMEGIAIDPDNVVGGDLSRAVVAIAQPPISVNVREHAAKAEQDLLSSFNFSPSAIGITQNVTAQEIRYQRDYTDSEFGRYAAARDRMLSTFAYLALRAFVAAMLDDGDMESDDDGAEEDADLEAADLAEDADAAFFDDETGASLREEGGEEDPRLVDEDLDDLADDDDDEGEEGDDDNTEQDETFAEALDDGVEVDDDAAEVYAERGIETTGEETIQLLDAKRELMVIRVEDIDSEFDIGFTETGRTPASDAEIRANLAQILPMYMQLFEAIAQGGPQGVIAEAAARAYYTEYSLPETLNPDRLLAQLAESEKEAGAGQMPPGGPPGAPPAEGGAAEQAEAPPAEGGAAPNDPAVLLNELVTLHKDNPDAVPALKTLLSVLQQAPPEVAMQVGEQLARIIAMPPEAQVEGLQALAQALTGGAEGPPPPPQEAAQAEPTQAPPAEAQAPAGPPQAAAEGDAAIIQQRLQEAAPNIEQAVKLGQELLPQLQAAVGEQGAEGLARMTESIAKAIELVNAATQAPSLDEAEDMLETASDLLEAAEGLLETLARSAGPDLQAAIDQMVDAVSDAADALTDDDPADGPGMDEEDGDDV